MLEIQEHDVKVNINNGVAVMRDDGKLLLSKDCIGAFLNELSPEDRFEVMTCNIQPSLAFNTKRGADAQAKQDALAFLAKAQANGGTVLNPALTTAYKYADPDRPLNVVILSDGLTEQGERRALLELIGARPRNAKVFCIGVGNDVNRPLLEQVASDSGGLASFLSPGDNFARQAKAFRRKLMNPVATDLQLNISGNGIEVVELEPRQMPNLFHGSPVRVYGRYRGKGTAKVSLRGNLNGVEWKQSADIELPKQDTTNPEIERMWASHRIDALLKASERTGTREQVIVALALLTCGALASRASRKPSALRTAARVVGALLLLLLACFSGFGFLASYEYSASADRLPWQVGYGMLGISAVIAAAGVAFRALRRTPR